MTENTVQDTIKEVCTLVVRETDEFGVHYNMFMCNDFEDAVRLVKKNYLRPRHFHFIDDYREEKSLRSDDYQQYKNDVEKLYNLCKNNKAIWIPTWYRKGHGYYILLLRHAETKTQLQWTENIDDSITLG